MGYTTGSTRTMDGRRWGLGNRLGLSQNSESFLNQNHFFSIRTKRTIITFSQSELKELSEAFLNQIVKDFSDFFWLRLAGREKTANYSNYSKLRRGLFGWFFSQSELKELSEAFLNQNHFFSIRTKRTIITFSQSDWKRLEKIFSQSELKERLEFLCSAGGTANYSNYSKLRRLLVGRFFSQSDCKERLENLNQN